MSRYIEVCGPVTGGNSEAGSEKSCLVALYRGIDPQELAVTLHTIFSPRSLDLQVVGLEDAENGLILPLSVACKALGVLSSSRYRLIYSNKNRNSSYSNDEGENKKNIRAEAPNEEDIDRYEEMRSIILEMFEEGKGLLRQKILGQDGEAYEEDEILFRKLKLQIAILLKLAEESEERIEATYQAYEMDGNLIEFKDTLRHLAVLKQEEYLREIRKRKKDASYEDDDGENNDDAEACLTGDEMVEIISMLERNEFLTQEECVVLSRLAVMEHPLVRAACSVFMESNDEEDLADTMIRVSKRLSLTKLLDDLLEDDYISELEYDHLKGESTLLQGWCSYALAPLSQETAAEFIKVLMKVLYAETAPKMAFISRLQQQNKLSKHESGILLELLENNDDAILAAFDVFRLDADVEDLCDTLMRIAKRKGIGSISSSEFGNKATTTDSSKPLPGSLHQRAGIGQEHQELRDLIKALRNDGVIDQNQYQTLHSYIDDDNELVMAAYDAYTVTDDVHDLIDTLKRIACIDPSLVKGPKKEAQISSPKEGANDSTESKHNANKNESEDEVLEDCLNHMFSMVEEGTLSYDEAKHLSDLLSESECAQSDMILAAFDVYRDHKNRSDFADTLKRIWVLSGLYEARDDTSDYDDEDDYDDDEDLEEVFLEEDEDSLDFNEDEDDY